MLPAAAVTALCLIGKQQGEQVRRKTADELFFVSPAPGPHLCFTGRAGRLVMISDALILDLAVKPLKLRIQGFRETFQGNNEVVHDSTDWFYYTIPKSLKNIDTFSTIINRFLITTGRGQASPLVAVSLHCWLKANYCCTYCH